MRLRLGNCNYSSWSLRAWLIARHAGLAFEELRIALGTPAAAAALQTLCPARRVPVLEDGALRVWDSLAIAEYLAERTPGLWPRSAARRAEARSMCAEMHAGCEALRAELPMNCRRAPAPVAVSSRCQADIERVIELWTGRLRATGPWLFAGWTIADAFFAPVALRFHSYAITLPPIARDYVQRQRSDPFVREWCARAEAEPEVISAAERPRVADRPPSAPVSAVDVAHRGIERGRCA